MSVICALVNLALPKALGWYDCSQRNAQQSLVMSQSHFRFNFEPIIFRKIEFQDFKNCVVAAFLTFNMPKESFCRLS